LEGWSRWLNRWGAHAAGQLTCAAMCADVAYSSDCSPVQKVAGASGGGQGGEDTEDIAEGEADTVKDGERQGGAEGGQQQWHYFSDTTVKAVPV